MRDTFEYMHGSASGRLRDAEEMAEEGLPPGDELWDDDVDYVIDFEKEEDDGEETL